ncbi:MULTISPECIES: acyl carrier protein [Streptomyces]|uniref:Acyl carrier protein n=1 Tax=Streptomyces canarius TaxID=285453 RepID=A0ABQ3CSG8_9ACTN|nr:phosphopantetheine-binding protein [Streptomyces canarius]GHA33726.1 acyl carrier protein [Streptomyces canarius]
MDSQTAGIVELLVERFGVEADEVRDDSRMRDLDLDSLALVEFGLAVEQKFQVKVSEDEIGPDNTVQDVVRLIDAKLAGDPR